MKTSRSILIRCLVSVALAMTLLGAHAQSNHYRTLVIQDAAAGEALVQGQIDEAIAVLTADEPTARGSFETHNNLCVAYMARKDLSAATSACSAAVASSDAKKRSLSAWATQPVHNQRAIALLNRGVLNALSGNIDAARGDFVASSRLDRRLEEPRANLERLLTRASAAKAAANR